MISVNFTQYLRPDGRPRSVRCEVADDLADDLNTIFNNSCWLTCEELSTGEAVFYITNADGDLHLQIVPNGPEVPAAVDRLIRGAKKALPEWLAAQAEEENGNG